MTANPASTTAALTRDLLLERASALMPVLKERAAGTEELRRVPEETVREILDAGLHLIGVPKRYGGLDIDYGVSHEVGVELARDARPHPGATRCGWPTRGWWVTGRGRRRKRFTAVGRTGLCSSSLSPGRSTCIPTEGGYRLSGRWEFSSGCDSASWIMLGVTGIGTRNWVLVPRGDYQIVDTWYVSGLKGSGSKDIAVEDIFIPAHRVVEVSTAGDSDLSGWELHGQDRYRVPVPVMLGWDLVAPMIGLARGMIDEFVEKLSGTSGPGRTADSAAIHLRLSQACAEVDAAQALMEGDVAETLRKGREGEPFTTLERARFRRDKAFCTQLGLQAVNRLFDLSGGHALFDSEPMQRFHRDAQAVAHRDGLIMDLGGQQFGRVLLGLEPDGSI